MSHLRLPIFLAMGSLVLVILVLVFFGFWSLDERRGGEIVIRDPRADATIVVSVVGAVATPGVYALEPGARVHDALVAAGGSAADADSESINPAAPLNDGQQVTVPTVAPTAVGGVAEGVTALSAGGRSAALPADETTLVNLNTASAAELETLPRIGPVLAAAIVEDRESAGLYETVDDLVRISGISYGIVEELRPLVTV